MSSAGAEPESVMGSVTGGSDDAVDSEVVVSADVAGGNEVLVVGATVTVALEAR